ncbi:uncharacterized protein [Prorops nasuta]|uniref:uncharacterized protein n=1 Tax=Prorops nasuta TaxID=863751 RepID=UPI0034CF1555
MRLPASTQCIKLLMVVFNLIFVITGIIMLSIGIIIYGVFGSYYHHFLDDKFLSVPSLLIAIGTIILFVAFFGCCGAIRQNYCMLLTFTSLLVLICIMELAAGISGYVLRAKAGQVIENKMELTMKDYPLKNTDITMVWDTLQKSLQCCGTMNQTDWVKIVNKDDSTTNLPMSCCSDIVGGIGSKPCVENGTNVYPVGCLPKLANEIKSHAVELGGVGVVIAFIQLTGVMIISVGTTIYAVYENFSHFLDPSYFSPATLLMVVGILIFVIAFLGCCGAIKESTCMVLVFAASLSIVLILELAAAISAYALQGTVKGLLQIKIHDTMQDYHTNEEAKIAIDFMHARLRCCGYNGPSDWMNITSPSNVKNQEDFNVPDSCCMYMESSTSSNTGHICTLAYSLGCIDRLSIIVHRSALYIGTGAIAIALIQLTGIMFACMLGRAIRRQKTERERRRWELRESIVNGYQPLGKSDPITTFPVVYMQSPDYPLKSNC